MYTLHICYMRYSWLLCRLKWKNVSPLWRRHHFFIIRCIYWNMRPTTISFDIFGSEYSLLQDENRISVLIDSLFAFDRSILNNTQGILTYQIYTPIYLMLNYILLPTQYIFYSDFCSIELRIISDPSIIWNHWNWKFQRNPIDKI